ncbi:MAG: hypothetical protein QOJ75_1335 [Chloroflexota bacterium]|nr:hypothetical protein [Chloroflexota bacterium]
MSVEFQPVKLGPRRQRGVDPVAIGALVVLIGLVAAVLKPWDTASSPAAIAPAGTAAETGATANASGSLTGPHATAVVGLPATVDSSETSSSSWSDVRSVISRHDAWGVRAIVNRPASNDAVGANKHLAELWYPIPGDDANGLATVDIDPNDRTVIALGITFPSDHLPIDARIWRVQPKGLRWVDTLALDPGPSGGAFLYRPASAGSPAPAWGAGRYRIDVLENGVVLRVGVTIPNRFSIVPEFSELPAEQEGLVAPELVPISQLDVGLFATVDGAAVMLPADEGPGLTEAGAWLNVDPGTGRAPRSYVATAFLPRATGLGVVLAAGSLIKDATVGRLAPDSAFQARADVTVFGGSSQKSYAGFLAPGGGAWEPGVYRFTVVWSDAEGFHTGNWHVELRPGPIREQPRLLAAARAFARYAGRSGVVVGTAEPLEGGPRSVAIRLLRPEPDGTTGFPVRDLVRCDGVRVDGLSGIVGMARPVDAPPSKVTARVLFEFSRSEEQPVLTASGDVPGLILVAPVGDLAPTSTVYRLRVGDNPNTPGSTVCLWTTPSSS